MANTKKTTAKKTPAKKIYTCRTCGKTTTEKKHLCNPGKLDEAYTCDYCGSSSSTVTPAAE
jgi:transcription elongation factor Elf1